MQGARLITIRNYNNLYEILVDDKRQTLFSFSILSDCTAHGSFFWYAKSPYSNNFGRPKFTQNTWDTGRRATQATAVFSVMERTERGKDDVQTDDEDPTDDEHVPETETTSTGETSPLKLKPGFTLASQTPLLKGTESKAAQDLRLQQADIARKIQAWNNENAFLARQAIECAIDMSQED